jgi:hypothetical protein
MKKEFTKLNRKNESSSCFLLFGRKKNLRDYLNKNKVNCNKLEFSNVPLWRINLQLHSNDIYQTKIKLSKKFIVLIMIEFNVLTENLIKLYSI